MAGHPLLFFGWKCGIELGDGIFIVTAIGCSAGDIHPLFALKCALYKFCDEQCRGIVAWGNKADVLLFAAYKSTADIVSGIAEIDINIVAHLASDLKGMLNKDLAELLPLILWSDTKRTKGKDLLSFPVLVLKPSLCIHNISDDLAVLFENESKLGNKVWVVAHHMHKIVLARAGDVDVPERLSGKLLY